MERQHYDHSYRQKSKNLVLISCFAYHFSADYKPLNEKNLLKDLKYYLYFCREVLHIPKSSIIVLTDIRIPSEIFSGKVKMCNSGHSYLSEMKKYLLLLQEDGNFIFFFSGHGAKTVEQFQPGIKEKNYWLVVPTGKKKSDLVSSSSLMYSFLEVFPRKINCFWFFDCCHSEGMVHLPYRWSWKGRKNFSTQIGNKFSLTFHPENIRIYSFHSSKMSEQSGFLGRGRYGSLFTSHCISMIAEKCRLGKQISLQRFLEKLRERMHSSITHKNQPIHQPIFLTNQNIESFSFGNFLH